MSYPIKNWLHIKRGYTFGEPTSYSAHHLGVDLIVPTGTKITAPSVGFVTTSTGRELGKTVFFRPDPKFNLDVLIRFGHNSAFGETGNVKKGDVIALSGNTGSLSTGPHSHVDISKHELMLNDFNNFINPDTFNWDYDIISDMTDQEYEDKIRALNTEIGTVTAARDKALADLKDTIQARDDNYAKWQQEIEARHAAENKCSADSDVLGKIRQLLG